MRANAAERLLLGPDRQPSWCLVRVLQSQGVLFWREACSHQLLADEEGNDLDF